MTSKTARTPEKTRWPENLHIIAEGGSNHGGDEAKARRLVEIAAEAAADSVKFQLIYPDGLYVRLYVGPGGTEENSVHTFRGTELLPDEAWSRLRDYAQEKELPLTLSIFDTRGLRLIEDLDLAYVKIASTDLNNIPLLTEVAGSGLPCILSTGLSTLGEVEAAVRVFEDSEALSRLSLLHCVSVYPCPLPEANLHRLQVLRKCFGVPVGFSDHTAGNVASAMAVALGATLLEKHFTYDRKAPGFDHAHALEPQALADYVQEMRQAALACSSRGTRLTPAEEITKIRARRGLYAARDLQPGEVLTAEDILVVRPSTALEPKDLFRLLGSEVKRPIRAYEALELESQVQAASSCTWKEADAYWRTEMTEKGVS